MVSEVLAFNKWSTAGIVVLDPGLKNYITLEPKFVPKTGARYIGNRFHKSRVFIVERFINKIMSSGHKSKKHFKSSGHNTGKAHNAYAIMERVLTKLEQKTGQNPIEVLVRAIENAAPREEIITIEYGGAKYPQSVECAPQRRIDIVIRLMTQGAYHKAFNSKKSSESCLTEEILNAFNSSLSSVAIAKKNELERQSDSSR